ncbi:MAG: leucine-rich repeat domain-containing protein [Ruminococcaceae bacterium]|nr:leucine-rich repeat domain-containing protein [Oscillospiraceae bacterium]
MALINELKGIGDAIREKTGETELIPLKEMADAILSISGGESVGYSSITYNEDDTVTLTQTNGAIRTMTCEYDGDKLVCLKYGNEVIPLTYEDDVLVGIGGMEVDIGEAPSETRLKDYVEGALTELVDDTITKVGNYSFFYKTFTKVELPNCESVGSGGFLSSFIPTIILPKLKTATSNSFTSCDVTEVNFPLLTSGGDFSNCSELTRAVLSSIDNPKFKNCGKLAYCDLGTNVTTIPAEAFYSCSALETLIIRNPSVIPTKKGNSFTYSALQDTGFIYVPDDMVESYKTEWSGLAERIKPLSELEVVSNE